MKETEILTTHQYLSLIICALLLLPASAAGAADKSGTAAPVLKWQHGGCYNSWCETGWYSSPAAADRDGDGDIEVIASAYSVIHVCSVKQPNPPLTVPV